MSQPSAPAKSKQALLLLLSNGFNFLITFLLAPFLARSLSYDDNGTWGQLNLVNTYLVMVFGLGIGSIITLLLAENHGTEKRVTSVVFWLLLASACLAVTAASVMGMYSIQLFNNGVLKKLLLLYLPSTFLLVLSSTFSYYFVYFNRVKTLTVLLIGYNALKIAVMLLAVQINHSLESMVLYLNLLNLVYFAVQIRSLPSLVTSFSRQDKEQALIIIRKSSSYLLLGVLGYGMLYVDGWIVSKMLGVKDFALYRNGAIEIPFISSIYVSISAVMMPHLARLSTSNQVDELFKLKQRLSLTIACLIFPIVIFMVVNARTVIDLYLGSMYTLSGIVFAIYNISVLVRIADFQDLLVLRNKSRVILLSNLIAFTFNIIFNIVAVHYWHIAGAAFAYALTIFLLAALLTFYTLKVYQKKLFDYFSVKPLLSLLVLCTSLAWFSRLFITPQLPVLVVGLIVYLFLTYFVILRYLRYIDIAILPDGIQRILKRIL